MNKQMHHQLLFLLGIFILLPTTAYAECTQEEVKHFKEIADEYTYTYEFDEYTKKYAITFHSEEPDNYDYGILDVEKLDCTIDDDKEFTCHNINPGTYEIVITGVTDSCQRILKKEKIKLAKYNEYANDPLCEGIEEFVLCQKTYDKDIDYDTFVSRVSTYRKTKSNQEVAPIIEEKEKSEIIVFIEKNLLKIILIVIFSIAVIVSLILSIKSAKKSRRLE